MTPLSTVRPWLGSLLLHAAAATGLLSAAWIGVHHEFTPSQMTIALAPDTDLTPPKVEFSSGDRPSRAPIQGPSMDRLPGAPATAWPVLAPRPVVLRDPSPAPLLLGSGPQHGPTCSAAALAAARSRVVGSGSGTGSGGAEDGVIGLGGAGGNGGAVGGEPGSGGGSAEGQGTALTASAGSGTGGGDTDVQVIGFTKPQYPPASRDRGEEGDVLLSVYVPAEGGKARVQVVQSSGYIRLDHAALGAYERARYAPARRNGRPVESTRQVTISFHLDDGA